MKSTLVLVVAIVLAALLRLPDLRVRPMHTDESVHADKFGTLLEEGRYVYDPSEYHGPSLYYLTLPSAWLRGQASYVAIDEATLRTVPALLGLALVAAHAGARSFLGGAGAALAALLAALSPAMAYYSRYYIHETGLVLFSFLALLAAFAYLRRPGAAWAALGGVAVGLMHATKETAPIALGAMLVALALARQRDGTATKSDGRSLLRDAALAMAVAFVVSSLLFTSFLTHPGGLVDSLRTYGLYLERANGATWHHHPWNYYLRLLLHFPASGTPFWTEGLIVLLAVVGGVAAWFANDLRETHRGALRLLTVYTGVMLVAYSAIPYKTPWCLLGFLHGMILLAGAGGVHALRLARRQTVRLALGALLCAGIAHLGWQAWAASFRFAADPRNPYVYAHTGTDVYAITKQVSALADAHPDGRAMPIQVYSRENLWPLPWYLRGFTRVGWWTGISDTAPNAPLILATPEMQGAVQRKLYELPPPGQRELYVGIFDEPAWLRPGVEVRGFASGTLWNAYRRLGSGDAASSDATSSSNGPAGNPDPS